jgi:parallel beta-helix repeat protein
MQRIIRLLVFFSCAMLLIFTPQTAVAGRCGGKRQCKCGDLVVSDYTLTADLGPCDKRGLRLTSGVTLDCRDHAIIGSGSQSAQIGISLSTKTTGATVQHCQVSGFRQGIRLREAHNNRVLRNTVHHNGDTTTHVGYGIDVARRSTENLFEGNRIHNNADEGIHIGAGSHRNTLIGNQVYDNFRENIYLLRADHVVLKNNTTHGGGANSLYLKHAAFCEIADNTFRDRSALVRGDAHDNRFTNNDFVKAGLRFQAYKEKGLWSHPRNNVVAGGKIVEAQQCLQFSDASDTVIQGTLLSRCGTAVTSTAASASANNTLIGIAVEPEALSLDEQSRVQVGWPFNVTVKNANGAAVAGAQVKAFDAQKKLVFEAVTVADGSIPSQEVIAYTQRGTTKTLLTPYTVQVTAGQATVTQEVTVENNVSLIVALPPASR